MAANESVEPDRVAFAAWAGARQRQLLRTAFLLTGGDRHRAEDLVQEVLAKVAVRWRRLDDGNLEGYIRRALVRTNISWWRSRRREDLVEQVPEDSADDVGERTDRRLVLARALARLTARQRAVVVLRYYEDRTEAQVADLLNISIGTVKSQTHAALARLRTAADRVASAGGDALCSQPGRSSPYWA